MNNPYPVMHGSMYTEPKSLEECNKTRCYECAYQNLDKCGNPSTDGFICEHRETLIEKELEQS